MPRPGSPGAGEAREANLLGAVSLAMVGTLADSNIVEVLRRFVQRSKSVELDLRTATSEEVSELVRRGEVTLGLRYFADESGLNSRIVGE